MEQRDLEQLLECPICLIQNEQPKMLMCQHSFCLLCLFRIYESQIDPKGKKGPQIECPVCKQVTVIPSGKQKKPLTKEMLDRVIPNNRTLIGLLEVERLQRAMKNTTEGREANDADETRKNCPECGSDPPWICLFCDLKLCNNCLGSHLDLEGEHEVFNLQEENEKLCSFSSQDASSSKQEESSFQELPSEQRLELKREISEQLGLRAYKSETSLPPLEQSLREHCLVSTPLENSLQPSASLQEVSAPHCPLPNDAWRLPGMTPKETASAPEEANPMMLNRPLPELPTFFPDFLTSPRTVDDYEDDRYCTIQETASEENSSAEEDSAVSTPPQDNVSPKPPIPRRALPPGLKKLVSAEQFGPIHPRKIAVGSDGSIYVSFEEANSGVRKFDREGNFQFKMANVQKVEDMVLDTVFNRILIIALYQTSPTTSEFVLQGYDTTTGQMIHMINLPSAHRHLCLVPPKNITLFMVEEAENRLKGYRRGTDLALKSSTVLKGICADEIRTLTAATNGILYILAKIAGQKAIVLSFTPTGEKFLVVPIPSNLLRNPTALHVHRHFLFIADPEQNKLLPLRLNGTEVKFQKLEGLVFSDHYNWQPNLLTLTPATQKFLLSDLASRNIWICDLPTMPIS